MTIHLDKARTVCCDANNVFFNFDAGTFGCCPSVQDSRNIPRVSSRCVGFKASVCNQIVTRFDQRSVGGQSCRVGITVDCIVAGTGLDLVVAGTTFDHVVGRGPGDLVVACITKESIATSTVGGNRIVAVPAAQSVFAIAAG